MNELQIINLEKGTISARELQTFLGVKKKFTDWMNYKIERYGFEEGRDFVPTLGTSKNGRNMIDYELTIETAKELAMVQGNAKGRTARKYFIECERIAKGKQTIEVSILRKKLDVYERMEQIKQIRKSLAREMRTLAKSMLEIKAQEQLIVNNTQLLLF